MTSILDIIKYLAKFPSKTGTLKNFSRTTEKVTGYNDLKDYMTNLSTSGLISGLDDYVWGTDEKIVVERIRNLKNYFMFVEYGKIDVSANDKNRIRDYGFNIGITIAHPFNDNNRDTAEELLVSQQCLTMLQNMVETIEADDLNKCTPTRLLEGSYIIAPVEPMLFYQNIGWVLSFNINQPVV